MGPIYSPIIITSWFTDVWDHSQAEPLQDIMKTWILINLLCCHVNEMKESSKCWNDWWVVLGNILTGFIVSWYVLNNRDTVCCWAGSSLFLHLILQQVDHVYNPVDISAHISVETRVTAASVTNRNQIRKQKLESHPVSPFTTADDTNNGVLVLVWTHQRSTRVFLQ